MTIDPDRRFDPAREPDEPDPPGLGDGAQEPLVAWDVAALVFRLQAQMEHHWVAAAEARNASAADRAELHRLLRRHIDDERPQLAAIRARLNIGTAALLAVGAWTLAGPDGLRQLGHAITGRGGLGFDGALALAGVLIPLVPPLFRILFLRGAPHGQDPHPRDEGPTD